MQKIIFLILMLMGGAAHSASFNCSKASTSLEKTICGHEGLSLLDSELGRLYFSLRNTFVTDDKNLFNLEHKRWLKSRAIQCQETDSACLLKYYQIRNNHLSFQKKLYLEKPVPLVKEKEKEACLFKSSRPIAIENKIGGFIATAEVTPQKCIDASLKMVVINAHKNEIIFQESIDVKTLTMYQDDFNYAELNTWVKQEANNKLNELLSMREWPEFEFSSVDDQYSQQSLWEKTHKRTDLSDEKKWDMLYALEECGFEYSITKKDYDLYKQEKLPLFGYSFGENGFYYSYVPSLGKIIKVGGGCY